MIVHRVTMDDLEEVVNLESIAFRTTKEQTRDDMVGGIKNHPDTFLVMQEDGKMIGHIFGLVFNKRYTENGLYFNNHPNQRDDRYRMTLNLAVLPIYRKQRIATKSTEALVRVVRKQRCRAISSTCLPKLIKFYKKRGFHNGGKVSDDIPDPTGVTSINMVRTL